MKIIASEMCAKLFFLLASAVIIKWALFGGCIDLSRFHGQAIPQNIGL